MQSCSYDFLSELLKSLLLFTVNLISPKLGKVETKETYWRNFFNRLSIRAGSVLTETEKPAVFDDFFGTETEMEPMFANFRNRERIGTEISEPGVPEV